MKENEILEVLWQKTVNGLIHWFPDSSKETFYPYYETRFATDENVWAVKLSRYLSRFMFYKNRVCLLSLSVKEFAERFAEYFEKDADRKLEAARQAEQIYSEVISALEDLI